MEPLLFSAIELRGLRLRNRVVVSPMLSYSATGGHANDEHLAHYARFATGGAGLVFLEATKIDPRGCSTARDLGLWKDEFVEPLARIAALVKRSGAAVGIQLSHSGRKARRSLPWEGNEPLAGCPGVDHGEPWELVGPSAVAHSPKYETPRELAPAEIDELIERWGQAAERAQRAGFDAIEIQGGHGYLVHQFLSPVANRRRDEYGGPLENRMRFALDVVRRIRRSWPREKPLFFRMSVVDDAGWTLDDSVVLARTLKEAGVDVIDCSSGGMLDAVRGGPPIGYGYQVEYARRIRELADVRTMAVGLIVHGDQAETIVREGSADLVALGREFLHNPNWPLDAAQKMGVAGAFGLAPARVGFWLEKRARVRGVRPSTWGRGIDGDEGAPREPAGEPGAKRP
ncbi:MAG: NADH:flavin oxidoreductase/NADH oxidase [Burkholderiales bacterium]|nr:NADH:flavin oxidoreductase/NADH oxidase [Burkholderiales bacterium]OJX06223.1 MAG: NADH:flavin oxidoreductase [Burkholderiales bacterium 70-64]